MSIANELSCDVAAAMLSLKEGQIVVNNKALTEIVLEFHSTLRRLTDEERQRRRSQLLLSKISSSSGGTTVSAASGTH